MKTKKEKLKELLMKFSGTDLTMMQGFKAFDEGVAKLKSDLQEKIKTGTLDDVNIALEQFRKKLDVTLTPFTQIKGEIITRDNELTANIRTQLEELRGELSDARGTNNDSVVSLEKEISDLESQLEEVSSREFPDFLTPIKDTEDRLTKLFDSEIKDIKNKDKTKELEKLIKDLEEALKKLRNELLSQINEKGGGSMNQKVSVNGTVMSKKYADFNLTGTGITATNNDTTKQVDISLSGLVGGSSLADVSADSLTTPNSLYTMSAGIPVEFRSSDGNPIFYVDETNERVGIGTNAPSGILELLRVNTANELYGTLYTTSAGSSFNLIFSRARGTVASPLKVLSGDELGAYYVRGHDGTNFGNNIAGITFQATQDYTTSAHGSNISFATTPNNSTSRVVRMLIDQNGFVGIGTTPTTLLDVNGTVTALVLALPNTTSATNGAINFGNGRFIHNFGGTNSIFMGVNAGNLTYSGVGNNIGIGTLAINAGTTGVRNVAIGVQALSLNTIGGSNVAIGYQAMQSNVDGLNNTAIGFSAFNLNASGNNSVAIGYNALVNSSVGTNNTTVGMSSLLLATGSNNVAYGYHAGENLTTGNNNIVIGFDVDTPSDTSANTLNIGNLIFGTAIDGTNKTLSSGNIGVGMTAPTRKLSIAQGTATTDDAFMSFNNSAERWVIGNQGSAVGASGTNSFAFFNGGYRFFIDGASFNVKVAGTAVRGTTEGTNHLDIFNGTAPVGTLTNGVSLYSSSGKLLMMDATGNGQEVAGLTATQIFTNKTLIATTNVVEEITTTASSATPTPTGGSLRNFFTITALAANATFAAPSGSPVDGNYLTVRYKSDATPRTLAFNAIYRFSSSVAAPTITTASKTAYFTARYNGADSKWDVLATNGDFT